MKILLLTTQPDWSSWRNKLSACRGGLGIARNIGKVVIEKRTYDLGKPPVAGGKIDRAWFNKLTLQAKKEGFQGVVLHFGETEARRWKIKNGLRGSTINDEVMGEMWLNADEKSKITYDDGRKVDRFVKVFLHECSHWFAKRLLGQEDQTHYWDYERHNIALAFTAYTFPLGLIERITQAFRKERVTLPLPSKYWTKKSISQGYAVPNTLYKSGIHAGVDFAVPEGTPIYAPTDGRIEHIWKDHPTIGNGCTYEFHYRGRLQTIRCMHMKKVPNIGSLRRGTIIGYTGNTGQSTGPHLHIELWKGGYDYETLLDKDTILETLINPYVFFGVLATNRN